MSLRYLFHTSLVMVAVLVLSCAVTTQTDVPSGQRMPGIGPAEKIQLPPPFATPSVRNNSKVIGWSKGRMPTAAPGFEVSLFAENLDSPRSAYVLSNVPVGSYRLRAKKDGHNWEREVQVAANQRAEVVIDIVQVESSPTERPAWCTGQWTGYTCMQFR